MRATTRPLLAAFLVVLTALAAATPAAATRPTAGGRVERIAWRPCVDDAAATCGVLRVPVDWHDPDPYAATVDIALARRPATDPARRIGTLVVNPGGPGASGVDFALDAATFFSPALRARFDIIGFDPRGVGRSHPVTCDPRLVGAAPSPLIGSPAEYAARITYNRRLAADCRARTGPVFDHLDSLSVARDLDALRAALGEARLSFYGASYATVLGAQYADRYPDRVRAIALDSVLDHSAGVTEFLAVETAAAQDGFDQFAAWCARDASCVLRGRDVRAVWAHLMSRAAAGTLANPYDPGRRLTVFELLDAAFGSFYTPQWYALAYYLKEAGVPARRRAPLDRPAGFPAIFCQDWSLPVTGYPDLRRHLARLRTRAPQMLASTLALSAVVGCLGWPHAPTNPQRRLRPVATPILLVGTRHDAPTAYAWAGRVAAQLGRNARLVTYRGWGHIAYGRTPCVTGVIDAYLINGRIRTTDCPGVVPPPFGVG
jgi:pimeloyl-ACP methyl ester carboxylesterase